jgi:phosphatidylglycerophosphatase A
VAPGTAGSAVALVLLWAIPLSTLGLAIAVGVVTVVGTWAAGRVEAAGTKKDPGIIVIDEVAGMALSVLAVPRTPAVLLAGFVLFRLFDVVKPFPANRSQALPGGPGVMADDLIAGVYALLVLVVARALTGYPA